MNWVDLLGHPVEVGRDVTAPVANTSLQRIQNGESVGDLSKLLFSNPSSFEAGELHNHIEYWEYVAQVSPAPKQSEVITRIKGKVSVDPYSMHFSGKSKAEKLSFLFRIGYFPSRLSSGKTRLLSGPSEIDFDTEKGSSLLGISNRLRPSGVSSETRQEAEILRVLTGNFGKQTSFGENTTTSSKKVQLV